MYAGHNINGSMKMGETWNALCPVAVAGLLAMSWPRWLFDSFFTVEAQGLTCGQSVRNVWWAN
jgi:hypothetical protein